MAISHDVVFSPEARDDLIALYDRIADQAGAARAWAYVARIEQTCMGLATFPLRGVAHGDIRPGLRVLGFRRRAVIAYAVAPGVVTILRILHGGRDLRGAWADPPDDGPLE